MKSKKKKLKKRVPLKKRLAKAWDEVVYTERPHQYFKVKDSLMFPRFCKAAGVK